MLKQMLAASAVLALAACATTAPSAPSAAPTPSAPTPAASATIFNMAATTSWQSEERLLPQLPILALVGPSGQINDLQGVQLTCNPDTTKITGRISHQPSSRAGSTAIYRLRAGAETQQLEGKFEAKGSESDFVFAMPNAALTAMSKADTVNFVSDTGDVQWGFVKDAGAASNARYVGSLKNFAQAAEAFSVFCNPK